MALPTYGDPSAERLSNGRSMLDSMRPGKHGLKGAIISGATPGGVPVNFNPHDRGQIEINIVDPNGGGTRGITLSQMSATNIDQAFATVNPQVSGNDINSIRERTAMVFEELARMPKSSVQRVPVKTAVRGAPTPQPTEDEIVAELEKESRTPTVAAAPPLEQIDRNYSPMAAFGLKKQPPIVPNANHPMGSKTTTSGPPQKLLYFEKEGIGTVPAFFHDVLIHVGRAEPDSPEENGFVVLVYDLRFEQNAARWFPPSNDPYQRPWAVKINDDNRLYLVHTTGFQYVYDNREYCVLLVERAVRVTQPE